MELINRFKKYYNIQLFIGNKLKISKFAKIFELLFNSIIHIYFFVYKIYFIILTVSFCICFKLYLCVRNFF